MSKYLILLVGTVLSSVACADWSLDPAWESPTDFKNPESVVYDRSRDRLIVSNVNGAPTDKDGNGFLSLMTMGGQIKQLEWVKGLDAPKGMALVKDRLYVADIDALVEINLNSGKIERRHLAEGAKFLNDVAADTGGDVYVSDMATDTIYRKNCCAFTAWLSSPGLENPNGLTVRKGKLYVGSWGVMAADMSTKVPGHIKVVAIADKSINDFGSNKAIGNMDGIEQLADGQILATDWVAGTIMTISPRGLVAKLLTLGPGAADLGYISSQSLAIVPLMKDNRIRAFRVKKVLAEPPSPSN